MEQSHRATTSIFIYLKVSLLVSRNHWQSFILVLDNFLANCLGSYNGSKNYFSFSMIFCLVFEAIWSLTTCNLTAILENSQSFDNFYWHLCISMIRKTQFLRKAPFLFTNYVSPVVVIPDCILITTGTTFKGTHQAPQSLNFLLNLTVNSGFETWMCWWIS